MIRTLLTIVSLLGLLLSVGAWAASFHGVWFLTHRAVYRVSYHSLRISWHLDASEYGPALVHGPSARGSVPKRKWTPQIKVNSSGPHAVVFVHVPLWLPTICFAVLTVYLAPYSVYRRRKRKKLGLCLKCGYDLRGSKERCPECGTEFETTCVQWSP